MSDQRRRRGFERAGSQGPGMLGLSSHRARRLRLVVAWRRVAGEELADRVRPKGVSRGIVEFECGDPLWKERVEPVLADLAARLAAVATGPKIRRYRLLDPAAAGERKPPSSPIPDTTPPVREGSPKRGETARPSHDAGPPDEETRRERLRDVMRAYLERSEV